MRAVVIRNAKIDPVDTGRGERLVALLATGLERLFSRNQIEKSAPLPVDYSESLSPTTHTNEVDGTGAALS